MQTVAFMLGGPWDIAIVAAVVLLLFGGSKLAGFGKNLGMGIKEFKKATTDEEPAAIAAPPPAAIAPPPPAAIAPPPPAAIAPPPPAAIAPPAPTPVVTTRTGEEN